MLRMIIWMFILAIVVRAVFNYLFPIMRITSATNDRLRKMQQQMQEMDRKMNEANTAKQQPQPKKVKKEGDYIDYEELR